MKLQQCVNPKAISLYVNFPMEKCLDMIFIFLTQGTIKKVLSRIIIVKMGYTMPFDV
jgi:hypothetical protein